MKRVRRQHSPSTALRVSSVRKVDVGSSSVTAANDCLAWTSSPMYLENNMETTLMTDYCPPSASELSINVLDLPDDVLAVIFSFLGPKAVAYAARTCKTFWRVVDENYWEPRARRKWPSCLVDRYGYDWKALYMDNNRQSYEGKFEWIVTDFSKKEEKKLFGPKFEIGGFPWCVLLFPKGNHDPTCLAFYLKPGEENEEYTMRNAKITFTVINQKDPQKSRARKCEHFFDRGEPDWGFTSFMRFTELNSPDAGFLENDRLILTTEVSVVPYRAAHDLDPDDEDAVERVAQETGVALEIARKAYIDTRKNEHIHDLKKSMAEAIKNIKTKPHRYTKSKSKGGKETSSEGVEKSSENADSDDDTTQNGA